MPRVAKTSHILYFRNDPSATTLHLLPCDEEMDSMPTKMKMPTRSKTNPLRTELQKIRNVPPQLLILANPRLLLLPLDPLLLRHLALSLAL